MILAILQARTSSTRLPGKVLQDLAGEHMVLRQIERLRRSELIDQLVVATSLDPSDDELVAVLERAGVLVRRGSLNDVVARFAAVVDEFAPEHIVRLTSDCPLTDVAVIDRVIRRHLETGSDYTSNTLNPTFPDGLDVECISAAAFTRLRERDLTDMEREHVTMAFYTHPDEFTLQNVSQEPDRSGLRWTVDVPDDLTFVRAVYERLYAAKPDFSQDDIVELLQREPALNRTDELVARNSGLNT